VNDTQLLERLGTAYATVVAPAPSAELMACMARGGIVDGDDEGHLEEEHRDAVVLPFAAYRPRARLRYSVAAAIAALAMFSGLAIAGALPGPVQRQVSSFASHFGLDLPTPGGDHGGGGASEHTSQTPATAPLTLPPATEPDVPPAAAAPGATGAPTISVPSTAGALTGTLGQVGAIGGAVTTTVPSSSGSPLPEPDVTLPPTTVPSTTVPSTTLPSTTLPPPTLPTLPPLPLPGL
jgi:hypothetical protein